MTDPTTVAPAFRLPGPPPSGDEDQPCRVCRRPYGEHSGASCSICRQAVEHHGPDDFAACLAGRQRMATARVLAGVALDDVDRLALAGEVAP